MNQQNYKRYSFELCCRISKKVKAALIDISILIMNQMTLCNVKRGFF